ncbi:MAG TPA: helix-hairpin-helix domain-containing protein [Pararobbsia sp.]|jgi:competence ComEA-like helix-hairpin-helix protein|nr:helix-hairpin-helix domain-containing protein [Pararobbsia sp.]
MCIIKRGFSVALVLALGASISSAYGSVDVNTSNEAALESITGIGTSKARAIVKEREANGPFKDEDDLAARISGLGPKSIAHLRENGLTIGSSATPGGGAAGARSASAAGSAAAQSPAQAKSAKRTTQGAQK